MQTNAPLLRAPAVHLLLTFFASLNLAVAAPLTSSTAAHTKPDDSAPVIKVLNAGTAPKVATDAPGTTPPGWLAVELPGPFQGYVMNKDVQKNLDIRTGAQVHSAPKPDSNVLTTIDGADKAEITGLLGKWTQIKLDKRMIGYVRVSQSAAAAGSTAPATSSRAAAAPLSPPPVPATAYGVTTAGRAAPQVSLGESSGNSLPRLLAGKFVSTRSPFKPRRPYDWALNDNAGKRYAFLDISKLLLTEQIESYIDHDVVVFGSAKPIAGTKDFVIEVESLQLK